MLRQLFAKRRLIVAACVLLVAGAVFAAFAHPFLAVTKRVEADILVVEGWVPAYMLPSAVDEFKKGRYTVMLVSGIQDGPATTTSHAQVTADALVDLGLPASAVIPCPAPHARWMRTSKMAKAVQTRISDLKLSPKGVNVLTAGAHARETWAAYGRAFDRAVPVGVVSVPKTNYPADRWWLTGQGWLWVTKDFAGWLKEVTLGPVS